MKPPAAKTSLAVAPASAALTAVNFLKRIFFAVVIFCSPLIFFTNLTVNPFAAQNIILTVSAAFLFLLYAAGARAEGKLEFSLSKADIWLALFILICAASLIYNGFADAERGAAVFSEGWRRGRLLLINVLFGYALAKFARPANEGDFASFDAGRLALLLLWAVLWTLFPAFKMRGVFDIYALLLWAAGIYVCFGVLREFTAKSFADIMLAVSAVSCLYGLTQNLGFEIFWNGQISQDFGSRAVSAFGNPNFLSSYVIMLMPLCALYFLSAQKLSAQFYYGFVLCAQSAFLAVSMTRSSWLGLALGALVLFSFKDFRKLIFSNKLKALCIVLLCAGFFILWPQGGGDGYKSSVVQRAGENKISAFNLDVPKEQINQAFHQRLMMWTCGLEAAKSAPVLGKGWGSFQLNYAPCQGRLLERYPQLNAVRTQANSAHNEFIETAAQSGFSGLLVYLTFFCISLFAFFKVYKNLALNARLFYAALFCGLCAVIADNMLNITMQTAIVGFAFWFILSLFNGAAAKRIVIKTGRAFSCALILSALILLGVLFYAQTNILRGGVLELRALKYFAAGDFVKSAAAARASVEKTGTRAEAFYTLLNSLLKTGDLGALDKYAALAQKRFPFYHEFYLHRAFAQSKTGDSAAAAQSLKSVLDLYPSHSPAAEGYAALIAQNRFLQTRENIAYVKLLAGRFYFNSLIKTAFCDILFQQGGYEEARAYIYPYLEEDNFNLDYIRILKTADDKLGIKRDDLLKKAQNFAKLKADLAGGGFNPAELEGQLKKTALDNPRDLNAAMLLGEFYYRTNRPLLALETIEPFYKTHAENFALNFALASANKALGRQDKAQEYLRFVLEKDYFNVTARARLDK